MHDQTDSRHQHRHHHGEVVEHQGQRPGAQHLDLFGRHAQHRNQQGQREKQSQPHEARADPRCPMFGCAGQQWRNDSRKHRQDRQSHQAKRDPIVHGRLVLDKGKGKCAEMWIRSSGSHWAPASTRRESHTSIRVGRVILRAVDR
jgi:hypothetical protein